MFICVFYLSSYFEYQNTVNAYNKISKQNFNNYGYIKAEKRDINLKNLRLLKLNSSQENNLTQPKTPVLGLIRSPRNTINEADSLLFATKSAGRKKYGDNQVKSETLSNLLKDHLNYPHLNEISSTPIVPRNKSKLRNDRYGKIQNLKKVPGKIKHAETRYGENSELNQIKGIYKNSEQLMSSIPTINQLKEKYGNLNEPKPSQKPITLSSTVLPKKNFNIQIYSYPKSNEKMVFNQKNTKGRKAKENTKIQNHASPIRSLNNKKAFPISEEQNRQLSIPFGATKHRQSLSSSKSILSPSSQDYFEAFEKEIFKSKLLRESAKLIREGSWMSPRNRMFTEKESLKIFTRDSKKHKIEPAENYTKPPLSTDLQKTEKIYQMSNKNKQKYRDDNKKTFSDNNKTTIEHFQRGIVEKNTNESNHHLSPKYQQTEIEPYQRSMKERPRHYPINEPDYGKELNHYARKNPGGFSPYSQLNFEHKLKNYQVSGLDGKYQQPHYIPSYNTRKNNDLISSERPYFTNKYQPKLLHKF